LKPTGNEKVPRQTTRDFKSVEVFRVLPELFSWLFYVAASRLNSPRVSSCLYAPQTATVKLGHSFDLKYAEGVH